jgi:hypothetical protein
MEELMMAAAALMPFSVMVVPTPPMSMIIMVFFAMMPFVMMAVIMIVMMVMVMMAVIPAPIVKVLIPVIIFPIEAASALTGASGKDDHYQKYT